MIVNRARIDAVTITSRCRELFEAGTYHLQLNAYELQKQHGNFRLLNYVGWLSPDGHVSVASRHVKDVEEYLLQLRGEHTEALFDSFRLEYPHNITRIDVQYTSTSPYPSLHDLCKMLESSGLHHELRSSREGIRTIYVGERTGAKMIRLYEKPTTEGTLLRYELELKKEPAKKFGTLLMRSEAARYQFLAASLDRLPLSVQSNLLLPFGEPYKRSSRDVVHEETFVSKEQGYYNWFHEVVIPSFVKRMNRAIDESSGDYDIVQPYFDLVQEISIAQQAALRYYTEQMNERMFGHDNPNLLPNGRSKHLNRQTQDID